MADASERIIVLSAVVLVIILWIPNSGLMRPLGTVFDIEIEITTSRDNYTLGESFTATLHLVNNGSKDVWLNPIYELPFRGSSVNDPEPETVVIHLDWIQGAKIHVPPKSKKSIFEREFKPQYSGEFIITCFGVKKTVLILDPEQGVSVGSWSLNDGGGLDRIPRDENAWVTATVLNFEPSPTLKIVELSSDDKDIPRSLFTAIDKALLDHESVQEERPSRVPEATRRFAMPIDEAESIIRYFGEEIEEGRNAYEFYVSFLDYVFSILIQFSIQVTS